MTDKMNLNAANARPSPPSITGEPGKGDIARATGGVGDRASSPARDNSLLPERVTLLSSGESRKVNESLRLDAGFEGAGGLVAQTPDTAEPASDHIGDGNKMGGPGGLISRAAAAHAAYVVCAETRHVSLGLKASDVIRALPAAAQGEPVAWLVESANISMRWLYHRKPSDAALTARNMTVTPLYAHPSYASLREEVERLRAALDKVADERMTADMRRITAEARIAELEARNHALMLPQPVSPEVQAVADAVASWINSREGDDTAEQIAVASIEAFKRAHSAELEAERLALIAAVYEDAARRIRSLVRNPWDDGTRTTAPQRSHLIDRENIGKEAAARLVESLAPAHILAALSQPAQGGEGGAVDADQRAVTERMSRRRYAAPTAQKGGE